MSEVSRLIIRPSLEGTFADSLMVCVWMDISLLVFSGLIRWMPSPRVSPVTLPNRVRPPTCPVPTLVTELNIRITSRNAATPNATRRNKPRPPPPSIIRPRAGSKMVMTVLPPDDHRAESAMGISDLGEAGAKAGIGLDDMGGG